MNFRTLLFCSVLLALQLFPVASFATDACTDPGYRSTLLRAQQTSSKPFRLCSSNNDNAIAALKFIAGEPIAEIERKARPCASTNWPQCSTDGFLGPKESLIQRLLIDNQTARSIGLTHQQLARPLLEMRNLSGHCQGANGVGRCQFGNRSFDVTIAMTFGFQDSIFNDGLQSNSVVRATNRQTGETIEYDGDLLPNYIAMYGFYEGDTPYRISPEAIARFIGFTRR